MFHQLLSCTSISLSMHVMVSEIGKKVVRSTKGAKKVEVLIKNMFFWQTVYSV